MLYLVSTPIGNLKDITLRAIEILFSVDVIVCEDTRVTRKLLDTYSDGRLIPRLLSFYEEIEYKRTPEVLSMLGEGMTIALVSDAGTPTIADPGYKLVRSAIEKKIPVVSIPGANAAITALISSGIPTDRYCFLGFLPKKDHARMELLATYYRLNELLEATLIFYESPYRLVKTVAEITEIFHTPTIAVCGELTKMHEKVLAGKSNQVQAQLKSISLKGEWVILIAKNSYENIDIREEVKKDGDGTSKQSTCEK